MKLDSNFIAFCKQSIALEQRMAKQAGKRLNEAMRNNIKILMYWIGLQTSYLTLCQGYQVRENELI